MLLELDNFAVKILSRRFKGASPFPHVVLDKFVKKAYLKKALEGLPPIEEGGWITHQKNKFCYNEWWNLPSKLKQVFEDMMSPTFLSWLEKLTGVKGLVADPKLGGAGVHLMRPGGCLPVHVDFNTLPNGLYRRLNVFLYLNDGWESGWNGDLELWAGPSRKRMVLAKSILPATGRFVCFKSTESSWHGHPRLLRCPKHRARMSLACYYYTSKQPKGFDGEHSTLYIKGLK